LIVWALAQSYGDGHRSLVTPQKVLSEYNEDFLFLIWWIIVDNWSLKLKSFDKIQLSQQVDSWLEERDAFSKCVIACRLSRGL